LRESCEEFYNLEDLDQELSKLEKLHPIPPGEVRGFFHYLFLGYHQLTNKNDWVSYSQLGTKLREMAPSFESKFGKYKLSEWLRSLDEHFENREQKVRRIDPESTNRIALMREAYHQTRQPDGLAHKGQLGKALRELDSNYKSRFGSKNLSEWLDAYPHIFKTHEYYVCLVSLFSTE
jgi:hypothetical protein